MKKTDCKIEKVCYGDTSEFTSVIITVNGKRFSVSFHKSGYALLHFTTDMTIVNARSGNLRITGMYNESKCPSIDGTIRELKFVSE